jgi:hypothetical protein
MSTDSDRSLLERRADMISARFFPCGVSSFFSNGRAKNAS